MKHTITIDETTFKYKPTKLELTLERIAQNLETELALPLAESHAGSGEILKRETTDYKTITNLAGRLEPFEGAAIAYARRPYETGRYPPIPGETTDERIKRIKRQIHSNKPQYEQANILTPNWDLMITFRGPYIKNLLAKSLRITRALMYAAKDSPRRSVFLTDPTIDLPFGPTIEENPLVVDGDKIFLFLEHFFKEQTIS